MRALVIGGNGFIGSSLVEALRARGDAVTVLDRFAPRVDRDWSGVRYETGDLANIDVLAGLLDGIDQVFHLASSTVPSTADAEPARDVADNLLGTLGVLDAMRMHGVRRICYFSSGGTVYGNPCQVPVPEDHPLQPISSYGIVKVAIEHYLTMFQRQGWLDPVIIRPSNPYGPGQSLGGVQGAVAVFLGKALRGEAIQIWGDGEVVRDYIFIEDLISLVLRVADSSQTGSFNAGSGLGVSLNQLCATIRDVTGLALPAEYRPGRAFDVRAVVLDVARARRELDWQPLVGLREGLHRTWSAASGT